jgi:hypothetical protein
MAVTLTKPTSRADDTRALKTRLRRLTFSGNFTAASGEVVTAAQVGLLRIIGVRHSGMACQADQSTANELASVVAADQKSVTFKMYENATAGSPSALKTNAEPYTTGQFLDVEFIGF